MSEDRLRRVLNDVAGEAIPEDLDGWPLVEARLYGDELAADRGSPGYSAASSADERRGGEQAAWRPIGRGWLAPGRSLAPAAAIAALTLVITAAAAFVLSRSRGEEPDARIVARTTATPAAAAGVPTRTGPASAPNARRQGAALAGTLTFVSVGLQAVEADGAELRELFASDHGGFQPSWSPDRTRFAFVHSLEGDGRNCCNDVYVVNADGTGLRRLTRTPYPEEHPAWSPDGARIAYTAYPEDDRRQPWFSRPATEPSVFVLDLDDGESRRIARKASQPAWSPDSRRVAYVSNQPHYAGLSIVSADGGRAWELGDVTDGVEAPAWSPSGGRIAFAAAGDLYSIRPDGSGLTILTDTPIAESGPAWSPDGRHIAYERDRERSPHLWVMNADGSGQRQLLEKPRPSFEDIAWLPERSFAGFPSGGGADSLPAIPPRKPRQEAYLRLGGIAYRATGFERRGAFRHGGEFAVVRARREIAEASDPSRLRDGDATSLEPGTRVYRVEGYKPTYRLTARDAYGNQFQFEPWDRSGLETGADLLDIPGRPESVGITEMGKDGAGGALTIVPDREPAARLLGMARRAPLRQGIGDDPRYAVSFYVEGMATPVAVPAEVELSGEMLETIERALANGR